MYQDIFWCILSLTINIKKYVTYFGLTNIYNVMHPIYWEGT